VQQEVHSPREGGLFILRECLSMFLHILWCCKKMLDIGWIYTVHYDKNRMIRITPKISILKKSGLVVLNAYRCHVVIPAGQRGLFDALYTFRFASNMWNFLITVYTILEFTREVYLTKLSWHCGSCWDKWWLLILSDWVRRAARHDFREIDRTCQ
jgi:hypothetical protein